MAPTLDTLPLIVLEQICEYLQASDHKWHGLKAFSLTSKRCCSIAEKQRFSQILLLVDGLDKLQDDLTRIHEEFGVGKRLCYVRRLRISTRAREEPKSTEEDIEMGMQVTSKREFYFDMHSFCRPRKIIRSPSHINAIQDPDCAEICHQLLARFASQLLGLQDLVWDCAVRLPPCILSVVHTVGCRLHIYGFRLDNLIRNGQRIGFTDPDDFAIATSPHLHSIAVPFYGDDTDGEDQVEIIIDHPNQEAVLCMLAGLAPNLTHIWMMPCLIDFSKNTFWDDRGFAPIVDPAGFEFFREVAVKDKIVLGGLKSLAIDLGVFAAHLDIDFVDWSLHTDFSKLRCLEITWNWNYSDDFEYDRDLLRPLSKMARLGALKSLRSLVIRLPLEGHRETQIAFITLLRCLNPLEVLDIRGPISKTAFRTALHHHGATLRKLRVFPSPSYNDGDSNLVLSDDLVLLLATKCPKLEEVELLIMRTGGDSREVGIYQALGGLPRLSRVRLHLRSVVRALRDGAREQGDYGGRSPRTSRLSFEDLHANFQECAFDVHLAHEIFDLISANGSLSYLVLNNGSYQRGRRDASVQSICDWIVRSWLCEKSLDGNIVASELNMKNRLQVRKKLEDLTDELCLSVWDSLWPRTASDPWESWESLALCESLV
ncbi:hypothetical protein F5Y04DRAFT_287479 [Hypomontagnella monticulosa]|nr:hypothetical protein F5Y04DRAFT_287479 [Hypomontagnella monticulosa]